MRVLHLFLGLLSLTLYPQPSKSADLTDCISGVLECVRLVLENGSPSFNPLELQNITLNFDDLHIPALAGSAFLNDLKLEGITKWKIVDLVAKTYVGIGGIGLRLTMKELSFPMINFETNMALNGLLSGKRLEGEGDFTLKIEAPKLNDLDFILILEPVNIIIKKMTPGWKNVNYMSDEDLKIGRESVQDFITARKQDLADLLFYIGWSLQQKKSADSGIKFEINDSVKQLFNGCNLSSCPF